MRFNRNNGEELNDGLLLFGEKKTLRNEETGEYLGSKFIEQGRLYYRLKSTIHSDYSEQFGISETVDLKVKTYYTELDTTKVVQINNDYYDILKLDRANDRLHMFIYLQKRKEL